MSGSSNDPLLEAVPNFSEGRSTDVIDAIAEALAVGGAYLADVHADEAHNRSVFTLFGTPTQLEHGLVAGAATAAERIDLREHEGVHPRVGACDVLPVVPLDDLVEGGGTMDQAIALARRVAGTIGLSLDVPTLLYGRAATQPGAATAFAGMLRRGGSAGLEARIASGELTPHAGPAQLHPTAGATIVGARAVLVAFNVELDTADDSAASAARVVAAAIRERDGGLAGVRALGLSLDGGATVQVSTNVERWRETDPAIVLEEVARLSPVPVRAAELVGLAPRIAWSALQVAAARIGVPVRASGEPVIERHAALARRRAPA